jgi:hypothetical protein
MFTELLHLLKRVGCKIALYLSARSMDRPPAIFLETRLEHDATSYFAMDQCCVDSPSCLRGRLEVLSEETEE